MTKKHNSCGTWDKNDIRILCLWYELLLYYFCIPYKLTRVIERQLLKYWLYKLFKILSKLQLWFKDSEKYNGQQYSLCAISIEHQQGSQHSLIMQHHAKLLRFLHCLLPLNKTNFCVFLEQHQRFYVIFVA